MKTKQFVVAGLVAVMLGFVGLAGPLPSHASSVSEQQAAGAPLTWNLADDFRLSPNQANPNPDSYGNPGIWSFMYTTAAHDPSAYSLIAHYYVNVRDIPGLEGWQGPEPIGYPNDGLPAIQMNTTDQPIVMDPKWVFPPGVIVVHPDSSQPAIVGWHSPFTGAIAVEGGVTDMCNMNGDGILWYIDKNSTTVASGSYPNEGSQLFKDGTNGAQLANIPVHQGDFIYFLVSPGGDYYCDGTVLDVTITAVAVSKPAVPTLVSPVNDATIPHARVTLNWSDVPSATRYKVIVKDEALVTVAAFTVFDASKIKLRLTQHKTYSWYVKACNSGGCSGKSDVWQFTN